MTCFDQVQLHTKRLLLRPLSPVDVEGLWGIFSDARVMRYCSTPPWDSRDEADAMVAFDKEAHRDGDYLRLGLERRTDRALIGTCTFFKLSEQCRRAEVGYSLAASAWGQGYMQEALSSLLDYGFSQLNLNRVEADVDPRNQASARTLERLGFVQEGYLRERWIVDGEISDTALYGLLCRDWRINESAKTAR